MGVEVGRGRGGGLIVEKGDGETEVKGRER